MKGVTPVVVLLLALVVAIQGRAASDKDQYQYDQYDDYYDDDYTEGSDNDRPRESEIEFKPKFVSQGATFTVDKGTTIRLPCYVDKLPKNFVMMWKRLDGEMLVMDKVVLSNAHQGRMSVEVKHEGANQGSTLVIGLAKDEDEGQYVCQMGAGEGAKIVHNVNVRVAPEITKSPANGLILATEGDDVQLWCEGKGSPKPNIVWSRMNKFLPDGSPTLSGNELEFPSVTRHHAGVYQCKADNGFAAEVTEKIEVIVEYKPEVQVEEVFIHAKAGTQVELVCTVHAHPMATVHWYKNEEIKLTNDNAVFKNQNHRHTLVFEQLSDDDFGNYTCRATNKRGMSAKELEISPLADYPDFQSNRNGNEANSFLLEWTVFSHTPVTEFELQVRESYPTDSNDWETIEVGSPTPQSTTQWAGKHSLSGLKRATWYDARVASRNDHGWSRMSDSFHFATFGAEPMSDPIRAVGGSNSLAPLSVFVVIISAVLNRIAC